MWVMVFKWLFAFFEREAGIIVRYQYYYNSSIGGRDCNEDSFCSIENQDCYLFVVADGLGGHGGGEVASGIAIDCVRNDFLRNPHNFDIESAIQNANLRIIHEQSHSSSKMKTTITALYISRETALVANVGDSRTYLFSGSSVFFQTTDHSATQMAVQVGEITKNEARHHPDRNILTRALGVTDNIHIDLTTIPCDAFSSILLCSDGFWEYVLEEEMCRLLATCATPKSWLSEMLLIHKSRVPVDHDNFTAVSAFRKDSKRN